MVTFLIVTALCGLLGFLVGLDEGDFFTGVGFSLVAAFFGSLFGFIAALVVGAIVYTDSHWEETTRTPLVNLADGAGVEGHFFLGSGTVDSVPSFTWYEERGENNYVRKDVDADEATVHYLTDDAAPYYTVREKKPDGGFVQDWGWNTYTTYGTEYDFYVPRGSITRDYRLDNR